MIEKKNICESVKESWLPELENEVVKVSKRIKSYFGSIKCRGEVRVITPSKETAYSDYNLEITVSFRQNQPLEGLAIGRQSGG